ncbi:quaternary amine ABC transporter ATP-binding protein [Fodinicurvata sediminis]|uniref:quaternary amine ABC transporter ATP-binding protein n=1 Tax=Fodinicurvata sediminis TaxID=1121832 RepID=UPI0003B5E137|nr:glycine betaine/L-proline ABC transporter ATP-binding protein [Fodinicurvata sediminis]
MAVKLETRDLYKVYGGQPETALSLATQGHHPSEILEKTAQMLAVSNVSFKVDEGEIFTIMGLSGSGKSTLVRCLNRLIEPTSGSILIDGEEISSKHRSQLRELRRRKLTMVFQNFALLPHKSVLDNVEFGLMLRGEPRKGRRKKAGEALEQVGLSAWAQRYPDNLSGGMKQRVGLARALASDADIMLMDEPFSALDPLIRADLQNELLRIQREIKKTIVFITHDFQEAVKLSDHVAMMRDGAFVQIGSPEEIVLNPIDDYVRNFAKDLDRARVITAGTMSGFGLDAIAASTPAASVLEIMTQASRNCVVVMNAYGKSEGYVFRKDIELQAELFGKVAKDFCNGTKVREVVASDPLINVYPLFQDGFPLAVLDESGRVTGTFDANDVLVHLADPDQVSRIPGTGEGSQASISVSSIPDRAN